MGIDARIFIAGAPDLSEEFKAEIGLLLSPYAKEEQRIFVGLYEGWTALEGYERYFGGGYSRGNWPRIKKAILRTIEEYPGLIVRYGGDDSDPEWLCEVTPELLEDLDKEWMYIYRCKVCDGVDYDHEGNPTDCPGPAPTEPPDL